MNWTVKVVGGEGGRTTLVTLHYPSRAKAAASLRAYGQSYVVRNSERCEYEVRPLRSESR